MGTSVSQASPTSGTAALNWSAVNASYLDPRVSVERVVQEIWKAAQRDSDSSWNTLLQAPAILDCRDVATASSTMEEALATASRRIALSGESSLATDVAKRAIVRGFSASERGLGYTAALFAEATNYLVSRDLSGLVGASERTSTVANAAVLRRAIVGSVEDSVHSFVANQQPPALGDSSGWRLYIARTVASLSGTEQGSTA